MYQKMPSLKALRAFEAVVRHRSATKAADELHVSPGAVSHQIRVLEQHLGFQLFERSAGELVPSIKALDIAGQVREGFDQIFGAVRHLRLSDNPSFSDRQLRYKFWCPLARPSHRQFLKETSQHPSSSQSDGRCA